MDGKLYPELSSFWLQSSTILILLAMSSPNPPLIPSPRKSTKSKLFYPMQSKPRNSFPLENFSPNLFNNSPTNHIIYIESFFQKSDSHTIDYRNVSPTIMPFSNSMCNNRSFTMRPNLVLSPKISLSMNMILGRMVKVNLKLKVKVKQIKFLMFVL